MKITLRFFASYREKTGVATSAIGLPDEADVARLKDALAGQYPALADVLPHALVAVNEEFASDTTPLHDGDTVAFFPPVSGG